MSFIVLNNNTSFLNDIIGKAANSCRISLNTVKDNLENIGKKTGFHSLIQAFLAIPKLILNILILSTLII